MRREERLRADLLVQMLDDAPREAEAVERAGAAADLVEDDEAPAGGVVEDVRRLAHLDHERALAPGEVVARADAREDAVEQVDPSRGGGDAAPGVREQREQRDLPDVGALACHVRPGDQRDLLLHEVERRVVGYEAFLGGRQVQHRMPSVADRQHAVVAHLGTDPAVQPRRLGEGREHVELRQRAGGLLDGAQLGEDLFAHLQEKVVLQLGRPLLGAEDLRLHRLQLLRDEPFAVGDRLLAHVVARDLREVGLGHLDVVAEDGVEPDLQRRDAGAGRLVLLELGEPVLAAARRRAQLVQLGAEAVTDDPAFFHRERWVVGDGAAEQLDERRQLGQLPGQLFQQRERDLGDIRHGLFVQGHLVGRHRGTGTGRRTDAREQRAERRDLFLGEAQRDEVAGVAGPEAEAGERALEVAHIGETRAEGLQHGRSGDPRGDRVLSAMDRRRRGERLGEPIAEPSRAHRRGGAVQRGEERGVPHRVAVERFEHLEVAQRRRVEHEIVRDLVEAEPREMRQVAAEMVCEVMEHRACRADGGGTVPQAETVERRDLEMFAQREDGGLGLEGPVVVAAQLGAGSGPRRKHARGVIGSDGTADDPGERARFRGQDQFRGTQALQLREQGLRLVELGHAEVAGGEVDDGEAEGLAVREDGGEEVVPLGLQQALVEVRARREDRGDRARDELAGPRLLGLVADGDLAAVLEQATDVVVRRVVR